VGWGPGGVGTKQRGPIVLELAAQEGVQRKLGNPVEPENLAQLVLQQDLGGKAQDSVKGTHIFGEARDRIWRGSRSDSVMIPGAGDPQAAGAVGLDRQTWVTMPVFASRSSV